MWVFSGAERRLSRHPAKSHSISYPLYVPSDDALSQITESFRRFGITESTRALLVIKVSTSQTITHDSVQQHLGSIIDGTATQFSNETLESMTDLARVRKIYKLTDGQPSKHRKSGKKSTAEDIVTPWTGNAGCWNFGDAENAILGAMALRGAS